jgi:hypothetical protein
MNFFAGWMIMFGLMLGADSVNNLAKAVEKQSQACTQSDLKENL